MLAKIRPTSPRSQLNMTSHLGFYLKYNANAFQNEFCHAKLTYRALKIPFEATIADEND